MKTIKSENYFLFVFVLFVYSNNVHAKSFWSSFRTPSVFRGLIVCFRPIQGFAQTLFDRFGVVTRTELRHERDVGIAKNKCDKKKMLEYIARIKRGLFTRIDQVEEKARESSQALRKYTDSTFNGLQKKVTEVGKESIEHKQNFQKRLHDGDAHLEIQLNKEQETNKNRFDALQQQLKQNDINFENYIALVKNNLNAMRNDFETMRYQVERLKEPLTDQQRRQIKFALALKNNDINLLNKHRAAGALAITLSSQK